MTFGAFQTSREIFENPIWLNVVEFRLFFLIYGKAVFKKEGCEVAGVFLKRGQWLRSFRNLRKDLEYVENRAVKSYSLSRIARAVEGLVKKNRIKTKSTELGTLFTVLNYDKYQALDNYNDVTETARERRENAERTQRERRWNNKKKDKKDKNVNKEKQEKEKSPKNSAPVFEVPESFRPAKKQKKPDPAFEIPENLKTDAFYKVWDEWQEHRKQIKKKLTPLAAKKQIKKLSEMGLDRAIKAINYSITNGWQGIFEPNKQTKSQNSQGSWLEDLQNIDLEA